MLISEIPFKKVRELAERLSNITADQEIEIVDAFSWLDAPGGREFWVAVSYAQWEQAKAIWPQLFDEQEEGQPAKTANQIVPMHMPPLPGKWIYTGEYRRPHKGEFILIDGKVRISRGQEMAYPIVVREAETD